MENSNPEKTQNLGQTVISPEVEQTAPPVAEAPASPAPKRSGTKKLALVLGGLIVLVLGGVGAYVVLSKSGIVKTNQPIASSTATKATTPATSSSSATPVSSSDSAITTDLQSADTSLSQSSADQSSGDTALNDASQQITVPTN